MASAFIFDAATTSWSAAPALPSPRARAQSHLLPDGSVLLVGGYGVNGPLSDGVIWKPGTAAWTTTSTFGPAREGASLASLADGRVILAGGVSTDGTGAILSSSVVFDQTTGLWANGPELVSPRAYAVAALVGTKTFLLGGYGSGGIQKPLDSLETLG